MIFMQLLLTGLVWPPHGLWELEPKEAGLALTLSTNSLHASRPANLTPNWFLRIRMTWAPTATPFGSTIVSWVPIAAPGNIAGRGLPALKVDEPGSHLAAAHVDLHFRVGLVWWWPAAIGELTQEPPDLRVQHHRLAAEFLRKTRRARRLSSSFHRHFAADLIRCRWRRGTVARALHARPGFARRRAMLYWHYCWRPKEPLLGATCDLRRTPSAYICRRYWMAMPLRVNPWVSVQMDWPREMVESLPATTACAVGAPLLGVDWIVESDVLAQNVRRVTRWGKQTTRQLSLQPVAVRAVLEVTKRLKPLLGQGHGARRCAASDPHRGGSHFPLISWCRSASQAFRMPPQPQIGASPSSDF